MSRFDFVKYDAIAKAKQAAIKAKCIELETLIMMIDGGGARERSIALTELENVYARCGRAIRDEQIVCRGAELQEERADE